MTTTDLRIERAEATIRAKEVPVPLALCRVDAEDLVTTLLSLTHQIDAAEDRGDRIDLRVQREIVRTEILRRMKERRR